MNSFVPSSVSVGINPMCIYYLTTQSTLVCRPYTLVIVVERNSPGKEVTRGQKGPSIHTVHSTSVRLLDKG